LEVQRVATKKSKKRPSAAENQPVASLDNELSQRGTIGDAHGAPLTTDQGVGLPTTDDSLKAGGRGPSLMEDFHLREKITHFDHERIPERVVHARGTGAHGFFQVYESLEEYTKAAFLCDPGLQTPVFVRFSTVVGSRGSADTVRDARGFATKFYTQEGNFDLVGNNIPVFFIQDGLKFPDLVHAIKPEPHHEMPQAASAHDTFWDFVSLVPETMHMVTWVMSDRGIPRSYRMMEGFGVHTFRLVNAKGKSSLVKFHWKPVLGVHQLVWDEAQKIAGKDPDFHRRDLFEAIENGAFPEYELGLQIVKETDELAYGFDLFDATKLLPEEVVPVRRVGRLTLNRNPDNFFAETEQVAFHIGNVVPGIDFTDDPLLQARLFSYLDTQLLRLGGPNFTQLPINRPLAGVHNHHQDGLAQHRVQKSRALYHPNSIENNEPTLASPDSGFVHHPAPVSRARTRARSETFLDHYSQAAMFLHSQSPAERCHLVEACQFEVGKVERLEIRQRVVDQFARIDPAFAREVAAGVGVQVREETSVTSAEKRLLDGENPSARRAAAPVPSSPALSMTSTPHDSILSRKIAFLIAPGVRAADVEVVRDALEAEGAVCELIAPVLGPVRTEEEGVLEPHKSHLTAHSVLYDAVFVPGGAVAIEAQKGTGVPIELVQEAFKHAKPIGALGEGIDLLAAAGLPGQQIPSRLRAMVGSDEGVVTAPAAEVDAFVTELIAAIQAHRHFERTVKAPPTPDVPDERRVHEKENTP
jgi:catalase